MENSGELMHPNGLPIEETVSHIRRGIKAYAVLVNDCKNDHYFFKAEHDGISNDAEMRELQAYRHLEDAAMRLGKVIQAKDGGKSIYDK
jgi:hypothetical protein